MFLYLACLASISFFLAICGVGHPLTIIIWFNKVVVVVVVKKKKKNSTRAQGKTQSEKGALSALLF